MKWPIKKVNSLFESVGKPFYYLFFIAVAIIFFTSILVHKFIGSLRAPIIPRFKYKKRKLKLNPQLITSLLLLMVIAGTFFWIVVIYRLPSPKELTQRKIELSTKIYDRNGVLLYTIYKDHNRTLIPFEKIPQDIKNATLAAEDSEFYSHRGFSIRGIIRSSFKNITEDKLSGGSTITQQLVKNALLSPEKTVARKLRELVLAMQVERIYEKDEIFEMYLNEVAFGGTAYGIQEASRYYFGKDAINLNLSESALLIGLIKSPTKFSPFGLNPESAIYRKNEVLDLMADRGYITRDQANQARAQNIQFAQQRTEILAPHFVMHVRQLLTNMYGEEIVSRGGLQVVTTLDYEIEKEAERIVAEEIAKIRNLNVGNGSALVIDPKSGEILSMVGSKDYFNTAEDGNVNVTTRLRQPGSSIKVINYALSLINGKSASTIIDDAPTTFSVPGQPPYIPNNYDGKYRGKISLRSALAESRNIPAVKLLKENGVVNMIELGRKMGVTSWQDPSQYGLSLTLGGGDLTLLELANVYATLANYGKRPTLSSILKVTDHKGKVLYTNTPQPEEVLDPRIAFIITDILKDNAARTPAFGANSALVIPIHREVAVKTGTSNNRRDNLTVGYSQDYLVAVWVGNNDNSPMSWVASGVTGASPIWNKIMTNVLAEKTNHSWEVPEGMVQAPICPYTGTLPCDGCPTKMEWFRVENQPTKYCRMEWFNENPRTQIPL